jgi:methanogenic corrinoid protein MtbC1
MSKDWRTFVAYWSDSIMENRKPDAYLDKQKDLSALMADLQEEAVLSMVRQRLAEGEDPLHIIDHCHKGMVRVGERYEQGIYYISGLIMAGEIMSEVGKLVLPLVESHVAAGDSGKIILGTVEGDIHFIGKNIFKVLVRCHGFTVHDLGEDVPPAAFLASTRELKPHIVGLSCLISTAFEAMHDTVALLKKNAQPGQPQPAVIIGGMIDEQVFRLVNADFWTDDAMKGVRLCQEIMKTQSHPV